MGRDATQNERAVARKRGGENSHSPPGHYRIHIARTKVAVVSKALEIWVLAFAAAVAVAWIGGLAGLAAGIGFRDGAGAFLLITLVLAVLSLAGVTEMAKKMRRWLS